MNSTESIACSDSLPTSPNTVCFVHLGGVLYKGYRKLEYTDQVVL
jgi:hypothetical protein